MDEDEPLCVKEFEEFFTSIGDSGVMMFMEGVRSNCLCQRITAATIAVRHGR